jgi:hypothetical protein
VYRVKNLIVGLQEKYPKAYFGVTCFQLMLYFVLGSHWFACIFFWIQMGAGEPPSLANGDPRALHLFQNGWAVAADFIDAQGYLLKWTTDGNVVTTNTDPSKGARYWMR